LDIVQNSQIGQNSSPNPVFVQVVQFAHCPEIPKERSLASALIAFEAQCPDHIEPGRWRQALDDGHRFLGEWGELAETLGWTADDLFGLADPPEHPHYSYRRLSRHDCTGLLWFLGGRPVIALGSMAGSSLDLGRRSLCAGFALGAGRPHRHPDRVARERGKAQAQYRQVRVRR
jgi:hypothetical protein